MLPVFPLRPTAILFALSAYGVYRGLKMHPRWWSVRALRLLAIGAMWIALVGFVLWLTRARPYALLGVRVGWIGTIVAAPLSVALLLSGLARKLVDRRSARVVEGSKEAITRRALFESAFAAVPVASVALSARGLVEARERAKLPVVEMPFAHLPEALDGLRILQLSDLHLGVSVFAKDLEEALVRATATGFDLLLVTGDVADRMDELEAALRLFDKHRPRLGVFASLGNHEYFHGIDGVRDRYAASKVTLLVDDGATIDVGGAKLHVAGADDPAGGASLDDSIANCARSAPDDAFKLLMCHRPKGFPIAASRGFDLVLSGHTHGGQVGVFGRSVFDFVLPHAFVWGSYTLPSSSARLYTTSGFGHWFPFRAGCPTEAPLIVLRKA